MTYWGVVTPIMHKKKNLVSQMKIVCVAHHSLDLSWTYNMMNWSNRHPKLLCFLMCGEHGKDGY